MCRDPWDDEERAGGVAYVAGQSRTIVAPFPKAESLAKFMGVKALLFSFFFVVSALSILQSVGTITQVLFFILLFYNKLQGWSVKLLKMMLVVGAQKYSPPQAQKDSP